MRASRKKNAGTAARRAAVCAVMAAALLCGCTAGQDASSVGAGPSGQDGSAVTSSVQTGGAGQSSTQPAADPVTLEQELLKRRGKAFDQSDYKKFLGGEGIIDTAAEFDCLLDHGYSKTINDIVVSGGKLYRANFNNVLANGKNIQEVGTLPGKEILFWHLTYDMEKGNLYLKSGAGYQISGVPFAVTPLDKAQYPLFKKVYRYAADGKTLTDCTAEFAHVDKVYDHATPMVAFAGGRISLLFSGKYLDKKTTDWNWYRDMGWREYIAFDLDLSVIDSETPVRLFNRNILMTDRAFYELVYASEPMEDSEEAAQLAPDGSVSPYYPAAAHQNFTLTLRRIDLLSRYYSDVRNISTSHVITADYTMLPLAEIMTEGYGEYQMYSCSRFYWNYLNDQ